MIYECAVLEVRRTEMETGSTCGSLEFGGSSAVHFVIGGTPVFRTPHRSTDLMPGDSIIFTDGKPYTVLNGAPSRSVILSILFKADLTEIRA